MGSTTIIKFGIKNIIMEIEYRQHHHGAAFSF